ncbi:MAG TPA: serine hydrolase domain-containing protein [Bryobacteraceae bacterium]|jgi:CubicO group peptidase (beta-lactamase class C family)|nr:serine hydrolase domain-containing protein [Bryobacteraceae bacterium]
MRTVVCVVLVACAAGAQPFQKQAEVDRIFSAFNSHTPGCAVGVAQNGKVVLKAGYGMADLERKVAITPNSVFESGSVAKQFTAAALLLLEQQGKISLDDPMRKYLPELPDYGSPVTIRQVISHISGLREWRPLAAFSGMPEGTYVYTNRDLLRLASQQRALNFDPGTAYSYTNTGYNIATILIERALGDGTTFQTFTRKHLFEPLGMTDTRWRDDFRAIVPNRALAYGRKGNVFVQQTPIENIIGAGGLLTTISDLLAWNENFTHAKVGGPALVKTQQTPATLSNGRTIAYASGLMISNIGGVREVSHGGSTGGYRTWLARYPDQGVSVAVLCNSSQAQPTSLGRETARLWTGAAAPGALARTYTPNPTELQRLAGMYRRTHDNTVVKLEWRDGKLTADKDLVLQPLAAGTFAIATSEQEFHFEEGTPGRVRIATPNGDTFLERVTPANPTASELAGLVGEYESSETGSTLSVALGTESGELKYRIGANAPVTLRPAYADVFVGPSGGAFRFVRDSSGKVVALSVGEARVWDLRFKRVR